MNIYNKVVLILFWGIMLNCYGARQIQNNCYELEKKTDFPFLIEWIDYYVKFNYKYPDNINQLIEFIEDAFEFNTNFVNEPEKTQTLSITLPKIKEYSESIKIRKLGNKCLITLKQDTLMYDGTPYLPCSMDSLLCKDSFLYFDAVLRFRDARFFNKDGKVIYITDCVQNLFESGIAIIKKKHVSLRPKTCYYEEDKDNGIIYSLLEYEANGQFSYFCKEEDFSSKLAYFVELKDYFDVFCKENNIYKIIFMTAEYLE